MGKSKFTFADSEVEYFEVAKKRVVELEFLWNVSI